MKTAVSALAALLLAAGLAGAGEEQKSDQSSRTMTDAKEITGTVKSVSTSSFVIDASGRDMTFETPKGTKVTAMGQTHTLGESPSGGTSATGTDTGTGTSGGSATGGSSSGSAAGASPRLAQLLSQNQNVTVKYKEKDGKMIAKEVRVQPSSSMQ